MAHKADEYWYISKIEKTAIKRSNSGGQISASLEGRRCYVFGW